MTQPTKKADFFEIFKQAHNNASGLLKEAEILFDNKFYPRAYFLAFTALEEISKSQFAADVFTGYSKRADFNKFFRNHQAKISNIVWAHCYSNSYPYNQIWLGPDIDDVEKIAPSEPLWEKRQDSLYVGVNENIIKTPKDKIKEKDAREIIHIVNTAFQRIWEVTGEFSGNQIGTKGFMK